MKKILIISAVILLLLSGALVILWKACDWPPPRLLLKYGLPPAGGPTGRTKVIEGIEFVELKPGYFRMGSQTGCRQGNLLGRLSARLGLPCGEQPDYAGPECPPHWVEIPRPILIARTEITNRTFRAFDPSHDAATSTGCDLRPVTWVTWLDATAFCAWLSEQTETLTFRLPSEAEWEYAARAGSTGRFCFGCDRLQFGSYGWSSENSSRRVHDVQTRKPNAWGLYDMHGNVWEWCLDNWHRSYLGALIQHPPVAPGDHLVDRGKVVGPGHGLDVVFAVIAFARPAV